MATTSCLWLFWTWNMSSTTEELNFKFYLIATDLSFNDHMWLRVTIIGSTALESAHHFCHNLLFEASHEANTDSREWRNILTPLMRGTVMILYIGAPRERSMVQYYNNLPCRLRGKGQVRAGMGVDNILYEWSPRHLKDSGVWRKIWRTWGRKPQDW